MQKCPKSFNTERQNRVGRTGADCQRYRCMYCVRKYTPEKKPQGYEAKVREQAIRMHVDGMNLRGTARHLRVHHMTISLWVKEYVNRLPEAPQPKKVKTAEMDELFTFIGKKKTKSS